MVRAVIVIERYRFVMVNDLGSSVLKNFQGPGRTRCGSIVGGGGGGSIDIASDRFACNRH